MKIIIKTKDVDLTEDLKHFIETRIGGLKKFIDVLKDDGPEGYPEKGKTLAEVFVEVEKETKHHKNGKIFSVKIRVNLPGKSLVAFSRADDLFKAIVGAKNELKTEIGKYKFKKIDKNRREQRKSKIYY